VKAEQFQLSCV